MDDLISDLLRWICSLEREQTQADYALVGPAK
jgi:hypothetical protein